MQPIWARGNERVKVKFLIDINLDINLSVNDLQYHMRYRKLSLIKYFQELISSVKLGH